MRTKLAKSKTATAMKPEPKSSLAAARWILTVGLALFAGAIALTTFFDARKGKPYDSTKSGAASSVRGPRTSVADDVPPWEAAKRQQQPTLPRGAVPASEVDPPPPDPNAPTPPPPIEPPNPATTLP